MLLGYSRIGKSSDHPRCPFDTGNWRKRLLRDSPPVSMSRKASSKSARIARRSVVPDQLVLCIRRGHRHLVLALWSDGWLYVLEQPYCPTTTERDYERHGTSLDSVRPYSAGSSHGLLREEKGGQAAANRQSSSLNRLASASKSATFPQSSNRPAR